MEDYIKRAEILSKFFGIYGYGNFDLSIEEVAHILEILDKNKNPQYLEVNLQEIYDRLYKARMG